MSGATRIAIIGMSGRFPGAPDVPAFWRNLRAGVESVRRLEDHEIELSYIFPRSVLDHPGYVKAAAVLDDVDRFDAAFFGVNPREAEIMDPQHRLFLECAWEAFENAGYDPARVGERVGVFSGAALNTYLLNNLYPNAAVTGSVGSVQLIVANDRDYLPTRVSYKLGLGGPSLNVQTACSTSLVATHLACESLRHGRCDLALAGGVTVKVPQHEGYLWLEGSIGSPDGHCRAFDRSAAGTLISSGVGIVLLKRLEDARRDGDRVRAVVLGSAVNNDGDGKDSYTAPGRAGQVRVVTEALREAGVSPRTLGYVEAHGTGTPLGDPTEIGALTDAFRAHTAERGFCAVGSVKTNIGHADAAAGIAGLIKTVLSLENGEIPPSLHFREANPRLELDSSPFYVAGELAPWPRTGTPRRAGVSSFGIGGTNAHVILEEAEQPQQEATARSWHVLPLSARTPQALARAGAALAAHLSEHPELPLADVAFTLQAGRRPFAHRRAVVAASTGEAALALEDEGGSGEAKGELPVVFLFPGQGSQSAGMAAGLYASEPVFREALDRCLDLAGDGAGLDLRELLLASEPEATAAAAEALRETRATQPALFAVEYALAETWRAAGVRPVASLGHSIGEYVAACVGGTLELADALRLVVARGRLMQEAPPGAMLAVPRAAAQLAANLPPELTVAVESAADRCVVAGPRAELEAWAEALLAEGVACRLLETSHAFHSPLMDPILDRFRAEVEAVRLAPPRIPWVSNLTGTWIGADEATSAAYWVEQLRRPVRLDSGLRSLLDRPRSAVLEVGPGRSLSSLVRRAGNGHVVLTSLPRPTGGTDDGRHFAASLGRLWTGGVEVAWEAGYAGERRQRVPLPTYPFERRRFWIEAAGRPAEPPAEDRAAAPQGAAGWLWAPAWRPAPRPVTDAGTTDAGTTDAGTTDAGTTDAGSWLLLGDGSGVAAAAARRLREEGQRVAVARFGAGFAQDDDGTYTVGRCSREDYEALLDAVESAGPLSDVLQLADLAPAGDADPGDAEASFFGPFHLARALGRRRRERERRLRWTVVSSGAYRVAGDERLRPRVATLLGPVRVIPQELDQVACRHVDVEPVSATAVDALAQRLIAEARSGDGTVVALRGESRWVEGLAPLAAEAPPPASPRLRDGGVYLITGGLGGIGLEIAADLAGARRVRLALLGRSPLPAAEERAAWLAAHGEDDPVSAQLRRIAELEALGAEVLTLQADVTDRASLAAAVEQARSRFGSIHGVVHAAGRAGRGMLQLKSPEDAAAVLAPKVTGSELLAELVAPQGLDFFVVCSSLISRVGGFGQVDYCAANAFLDAFAEAQAAHHGAPVVSIGWDAWQSVGMAVREGALAPPPAAGEAAGRFPGRQVAATGGRTVFRTDLDSRDWLVDEHRLGGKPTLPGTAHLDLVTSAWRRRGGDGPVRIEELYFLTPLTLEPDGRATVYTVLEPKGETVSFRVVAETEDGAWQEHARGRLAAGGGGEPPAEDLAALLQRCGRERLDFTAVAQGPSPDNFVQWGPRWESLREVHAGDGEAVALLELPAAFAGDLEAHDLHPALLDVATSFPLARLGGRVYLPLAYEQTVVRAALPRRFYSHVRFQLPAADAPAPDVMRLQVRLLDEAGRALVEVERFLMRHLPSRAGGQQPATAEAPPSGVAAEGVTYRLEVGSLGHFESLAPRAATRHPPGPGEIEIRVAAAGLNFKDVLIALGSLEAPLGQECAGTVVRVGEGVAGLAPGDRVMGLAPLCFGPWATTREDLAVRLPPGLDAGAAAGLPLAFVTAAYCLRRVARVQAGERVLIHAATGGVGLAAVQICRRAGAEIFASAGSEAKRDHLRSLGVTRLVDSRSLGFADQVRELTGGEGVDVVLNSLAGEFVAAGLGVLRPFGRFVEIGRRDILTGGGLDLAPFADNLTYVAVDVAQLAEQRPRVVAELLAELVEGLAAGELEPLPRRELPLREAARAFEHLAQARHVGKVVLTVPAQDEPAQDEPPASPRPAARPGRQELAAELGLDAAPAAPEAAAGVLGNALSPAEGVETFRMVLAQAKLPSQVVVTKAAVGELVAVAASRDRLLEAAARAAGRSGGHPRPELSTPFVAPRNDDETALAEIWQGVLGIEGVGVDDDFFELGGDSVLGIQVIARATEAGFEISPEQLFEGATVAALAAAGRRATGRQAESFPLSPVQRWELASQRHAQGAEWMVLQVDRGLDRVVLGRILQHLPQRHELLGCRLDGDGAAWRRSVSTAVPLHVVDLRAVPDGDVLAVARRLAARLDARQGPLLAATLVETGAGDRLLALHLHRLAADATSWRIVLDDLHRTYHRIARGLPPRHPRPAPGYSGWLEDLTPPPLDDGQRRRLEAWRAALDEAAVAPPEDGPVRTVRLRLDGQRTRALLERVVPAFRVEVDEVLLACLAAAGVALHVDLVRDARDDEEQGVVGRCQTVVPLVLAAPSGDAETALKAVKEQVRGLPGGRGGPLAALVAEGKAEAIAELPRAPVVLRYRPTAAPALPPDSPFALAGASVEAAVDMLAGRVLWIEAWQAEQGLELSWTERGEGAPERSRELLAALESVVDEVARSEAGGRTPSDFPEAGLSQDELDRFLGRLHPGGGDSGS